MITDMKRYSVRPRHKPLTADEAMLIGWIGGSLMLGTIWLVANWMDSLGVTV